MKDHHSIRLFGDCTPQRYPVLKFAMKSHIGFGLGIAALSRKESPSKNLSPCDLRSDVIKKLIQCSGKELI